ncbi:MAG: hypothetical protein WD751_04400 [Anaerolineales bacterium]
MKTKRISTVVALLALALLVSACDFSFSTANIPNAFMAADHDGTQPTTTFRQDAVFYAIVDLANAPDDTTVKAAWIAVNADGVEANFVIEDVEITSGDGRITFDLTNAPDMLWPLGQYRVDLYLNDELKTSLEFQVQ